MKIPVEDSTWTVTLVGAPVGAIVKDIDNI